MSYPLLQNVVDIVKAASKLMEEDSFKITQKEGFSNIVTSTDIEIQNYLCDHLKELLPNCGFFCEENDLCDNSKEYTWIIDPIDGTTNYSRGIWHCAICVGLKWNDEIVLGVVYIPSLGQMFTAERGKGAFLNGEKIHVSDRPFQNGIMCTALSDYHKEYAQICSNVIMDTFQQCNDIRRFGACAPELCYLAVGFCELYFEYLLSVWDYAAASLILTEAGGYISDLDGQPLTFKNHSGVLAANSKESLDKLVSIVKKYKK